MTKFMKKHIIAFIILAPLIYPLYSQNVYIPDQVFKDRLIGLGVDLNNDFEISYEEAAIVDHLDVSYYGGGQIESITGIEAFISLDTLICSDNSISTLDSLNNLPLKYLDCRWNPISSLQLSLSDLEFLKCLENNLPYLDISIYPKLHTLICNPSDSLKINNQFLNKLIVESFISINTSFAPELKTLICHSDPAPDLSNNSQLTYLEITGQFSNIDLSSNLLLEHLYLWGNLTSIELSNNSVLSYINVMQNNILYLDVSSNLEIDTLICRINNIHSLDLSNNLNLLYVDCSGNNISNFNVSNLSNLNSLICTNNQLTDINLNENVSLRWLEITFNHLNTIDLTHNTELEYFICAGNSITGSLDLSQNTNLQHINCSENNIQTLDLSNNTLLNAVWCQNNNIDELNINGLENLLGLHCFYNNLNQLDLYTNVSITSMQCSYNPIDSLDLSNNDSWIVVNLCFMPFLTKVCVSELPVQYTINTTGSPNAIIEICSFVGINEEFFNSLTIFPNPTKGKLNIKYNDLQKLTASLYNIHGEIVKENCLDLNKHIIDLSDLPNGVYFIKIRIGNDIIVRKILKI